MYVGMSADIVHHGHVNIISVAKNLGRVVVGLLTDEGAPALRCTKALMPALLTDKSWLAFCDAAAIESYKRKTVVPWENRKRLIEAIKGVDLVVPQTTLDYAPNLKWLRPAFVVHGSDWADPKGPQYAARQKVIDTLAEWQGQLIEPPYTGGISTTEIIKVSLAAWNLAPPILLTARALVCVCCADRCRTRCVAAFKLTAKGACLSLPPSGRFFSACAARSPRERIRVSPSSTVREFCAAVDTAIQKRSDRRETQQVRHGSRVALLHLNELYEMSSPSLSCTHDSNR